MDILDTIKTKGLLFDGAMGSILIAKGLEGGEAPEAWNLTRPDDIQGIHQDYYDAGADIATANTFGASAIKLAKMKAQQDMEDINRAGIKLARKACGKGQFIAADMGDPGEMLSPMGTLSKEEALDCFTSQASILAEESPDIFIIETIFDLNIACTAIKAIRSVTDLPVACTMTFKETPKGFFTIFGNAPEQSMKALVDEGADMVGANCAMGSDTMISLAGEIRNAVDVPIIIQPNAGLPQTGPDQSVTYPESPQFFSDNLMKIKALGVEVLGGCCGTTPEDINTVRQKLDQ
ncbi:MAG: homocysteine S-methyltransferase family protein [Desulfobacterales bacterium]|nr:homocysteine S-methyltransferase family protein [Desulfobacterales bacterium]